MLPRCGRHLLKLGIAISLSREVAYRISTTASENQAEQLDAPAVKNPYVSLSPYLGDGRRCCA